jgi:hypothetical protein
LLGLILKAKEDPEQNFMLIMNICHPATLHPYSFAPWMPQTLPGERFVGPAAHGKVCHVPRRFLASRPSSGYRRRAPGPG